jgi:hypothetical protein
MFWLQKDKVYIMRRKEELKLKREFDEGIETGALTSFKAFLIVILVWVMFLIVHFR